MHTRERHVWFAALFFGLAALLPAQQVAIADYLAGVGYPNQIAVGQDGALWYTSPQDNQIARMTPAGTSYTVFALPNAGSDPVGIVAGPDSALWFTEPPGNRIGRITTDGAITEYAVPTANSSPTGITRAADGTMWFTENAAHKIGRITAVGAITEFPVDSAGGPNEITVGPDNALWFTESGVNNIGQLTTEGRFTEYPVPYEGSSSMGGITTGPDGALWFTEYWQGVIGRITTAGVVTEYTIQTYAPEPTWITTGPDGALWFTEYYGNAIGRITTAGAFGTYYVPATYPPPDQGPAPTGIVSGPDGSLWFTENFGGRIGQVVFETAGLSIGSAQGVFEEQITFTGSGFAPNETVKTYTSGIGSPPLVTAAADSSGAFTVSAPVPQSIFGPRQFLAVGETSKLIGAASFNVNPRLILNPQSGSPGSSVEVQGFGFYAYWGVNIDWNRSTALGTADTNGIGTFDGGAAFTFTVPAGTQPGVYQIEASWSGVLAATASFTVN